jgi:serine protease Do
MNAASARRPVWCLSVSLAVLVALQPASLAQKTESHSVQPATLPQVASAALNRVFQNSRTAALRIEDCPPVAEDAACKEPNGVGSGVLISADGSVLTAYHVVFGATRLEAVTFDKKRFPITVVGFDEPHDLALLKINISGAAFVPLAPQAPKVGQAALAIGNAGGKFLQPKTGKLLALDAAAGRADFPPGTLQLDAPLAPGDSGGPILNDAGQLIGITSYIRIGQDTTGGAPKGKGQPSMQVSSYAVPVTAGSDLLAQLRAGVKREAPIVGIQTADPLTDGLTAEFFSDLGLGSKVGYVFTNLVKGGPADLAGLHPLVLTNFDAQGAPTHATGDVITQVDDKAVTNYLEFLAAIRSHQVGDRVVLTVYRDGAAKPLSVPVTLAPRTVSLGQTKP